MKQTAFAISFSISSAAAARNNGQSSLKLRGGSNNISSIETSSRRLESSCDTKWHPDPINSDGCSNSLSYPKEWKGVDSLFFDSKDDCCEFFRAGESCTIYDECQADEGPSVESPSTTLGCTSSEYHPDMVNKDGCSNSIGDYPAEWDDNKNVYFFPSATACCDFFFINQPCNTYQRCEDPNATGSPPLEPKTDCSNNKWFPDMNRKDGCSNSDDYDPGWNKEPMKSFYLHDSLQGCCEFFFKDDCQVYHDCEGGDTVGATPVTTSPPTRSPRPSTRSPTVSPSTASPTTAKPSASPTNYPTNSPSTSPSVAPIRYYMVFSTGMCTPLDAFTPYWFTDKDFYLDYAECCRNSFNKDACLAVSPTQKPSTMSPTTKSPIASLSPTAADASSRQPNTAAPTNLPTTKSPTSSPTVTPVKYYIVFSTGMCTPIDAFTPYWLTDKDFYLDYAECCRNSFNKDACLGLSPTQKPTTMSPSSRPSKNPTAKPTLQPSASPSGEPTTANPSTAPSMSPSTSPSSGPSVHPTSASPTTLQPTTKKPTGSPTRECESGLWHPSDDFSKCTNSFWYDKSWDNDPSLKATYLHETAKGCCDIFGAWNRECVIENICDLQSAQVQSTTTTSSTANSSCKSALWHPTESYSACTNDFDYKNEWSYSPLREIYLHESLVDCCASFFDAWDKECVVVDICASSVTLSTTTTSTRAHVTESITKDGESTTTTSTRSQVTPSINAESCESRPFHPTTDFSKCTNSMDYPESWALPQMRDNYLIESSVVCCERFFWPEGKDCPTSDECLDTSYTLKAPTKASLCESRLFHPTTDYKTCTNSLDFPESWMWPGMKEQFMFQNQEDCCTSFRFSMGYSDCEVYNECLEEVTTITRPTDPPTGTPTLKPSNEPTACSMNSYHPKTDFQACTNSFDYPKSWEYSSQQYLFPSKEQCCEIFFLGKSCPIYDACSNTTITVDPPTQSPSNKPTLYPTTLSPSKKPTIPPTRMPATSVPSTLSPSKAPVSSSPTSLSPTMSPTGSPSSSPIIIAWYPDRNPNYAEGRCINTMPVPQFRDTYNTLRKCCDSAYPGQSSGVCLSAEATDTESTSSTTSTTTILQYYSNPSSGMCATVDGDTPSWITTFYTDWEECCKAGWMFDKCMATAPTSLTEEETLESETESTPSIEDEPTTTSTTTTIVQYYSSPSSGMCATVDGNTPSWITTFYTDWEKCCKAGWMFDKCMAEAPTNLAEKENEEDGGPSTTTTTTATSTSVKYYSNPSNGMCAPVSSSTPSWIATFYADWEECCKAGWRFDECMAEFVP